MRFSITRHVLFVVSTVLHVAINVEQLIDERYINSWNIENKRYEVDIKKKKKNLKEKKSSIEDFAKRYDNYVYKVCKFIE